MECVFCLIISGEIPCFRVHEDEHTLAFMDINPLSEGHLLVIPKVHFENLLDPEADPEVLGQVMKPVPMLAKALSQALNTDSLTMLQSNGMWAAQSVLHYHIHLIPRRENDNLLLDWGLEAGDLKAIGKAGQKIREVLEESEG